MGAEHMGDRMRSCEVDQPIGAGREGRYLPFAHIEPAGIEAIAGQQDAGRPIVQRDTGDVVSRNGDDVQHAVTQIDLPEIGRPFGDASGLLDSVGSRGHELHAWRPLELRIGGRVVAMAVGMDHHQRNRGVMLARRPLRHEFLHDGRRGDRFGLSPRRPARHARVFEQRLLVPEDQVQKRLFRIDAARFAQDVEIFIVFMDLPVRNGYAVGAAGEPGLAEVAGRQTGLILGSRQRGIASQEESQRQPGRTGPKFQG